MEWDEETCLKLIAEYKSTEILWNSRNLLYYNKAKKEDAWKKLADKMGKDVDGVKKKMESLKGSYRREKTRVKKNAGTVNGQNKAYTSKWFGFEHLHFLEDKNELLKRRAEKARALSDAEEDSSSETQDEAFGEEREADRTETGEEVPTERTPVKDLSNEADEDFKFPNRRAKKRKKKDDEDPRVAKAFKYLEEAAAAAENKKDECSLFAEYIAQKLRTFDSRDRSLAQHRINNVLFELEMNACQDSQSPYVQPHPPIRAPQTSVQESILPHKRIKTEIDDDRTPVFANCSHPLSHFKREILPESVPKSLDTDSSRSTTPPGQQNFLRLSPNENDSPSSCNYQNQFSDSCNDILP